MSYIASNDNRLYTALETAYGQTADISTAQRFPAVRLTARQTVRAPLRRDKTGTRSHIGDPPGLKRRTEYELQTYLSAWSNQAQAPACGPLFEATFGSGPSTFAGGTIASTPSATSLQFQAAHNLQPGQAIVVADEIRFVRAASSATVIELNAPFSVTPPAGAEATPTVTYRPGKRLGSVTLFDYWSPETALQRIIRGVAVNQLQIKVNSDFHEFIFRGTAYDISDSRSLSGADGEPEEFPAEPDLSSFDYSIVPGHLGQAWLGTASDRFYTLTAAQISLTNNIETDPREFGAERLRGVVAGNRNTNIDLELFASDDEQTMALYDAARQRTGIRAMIQLGMQQGQLCGIYMKSVTPVLPDFNDSESRLSWRLRGCRAQGAGEDEIVIAFG